MISWNAKDVSLASICLVCIASIFFYSFEDDHSVNEVIAAGNKIASDSAIVDETDHQDAESASAPTDERSTDKNGSEKFLLRKVKRKNWRLEGGIREHFTDLKFKADSGENEARYVLAANLRYCYNAPLDERSLETKLHEVADEDLAIARINDKYEYCLGVDKSELPRFYYYLSSAAENGYVAAQEELGKIPSTFYMASQGHENLERNEFIRTRDAFDQLKLNALEQAAKKGSERALTQLSRMYSSQNYGKNGHAKSYAIDRLIMELTEDNELYNRFSWFSQKQYDQLSPEELDYAIDMSDKWLALILENGTVYPIQ